MANVRVVMIQAEGTDVVMSDLFRKLLASEIGMGGSTAGMAALEPKPGLAIAEALVKSAEQARVPAMPAAEKTFQKNRGGRKSKRASLAPAAATAAAPLRRTRAVQEDAAPAKVVELLKKRPMTTGELIKALPECTAPTIYSALSQFRAQGKIRMIEDPETIQKKNELVS